MPRRWWSVTASDAFPANPRDPGMSNADQRSRWVKLIGWVREPILRLVVGTALSFVLVNAVIYGLQEPIGTAVRASVRAVPATVLTLLAASLSEFGWCVLLPLFC